MSRRVSVVVGACLLLTFTSTAYADHGEWEAEVETASNHYTLGKEYSRDLVISYDGWDKNSTAIEDIRVNLETEGGTPIKTLFTDYTGDSYYSFENGDYRNSMSFKITEDEAQPGTYKIVINFTSSSCQVCNPDDYTDREFSQVAFLEDSEDDEGPNQDTNGGEGEDQTSGDQDTNGGTGEDAGSPIAVSDVSPVGVLTAFVAAIALQSLHRKWP